MLIFRECNRLFCGWGSRLLHLSFIFIIAGGIVTFFFGETGTMKISKGDKIVRNYKNAKGEDKRLPFGVSLDRFEIIFYPGGEVPRNYISHLYIEEISKSKNNSSLPKERVVISMNQILNRDGYRLYQAGYEGEDTTILKVNYDPLGIVLVYTGYALFTFGGLWMLISRKGRWRRMIKSFILILIFLLPFKAEAGHKISGIDEKIEEEWRGETVIYNGSRVTYDTFCREIIKKIYGKEHYRGLSAVRTISSFRLFPEQWKDEKLILVKSEYLRGRLNLKGKYASLSDLFDKEGRYKVEKFYSVSSPELRQEVEQLDEKAGILLSLFADPPRLGEEMSPAKREIELLYNRVKWSLLIVISLFCGAVLTGISLFRKKSGRAGMEWTDRMGWVMLYSGFGIALINFIFQWMIAGRVPLSNTYETLNFTLLAILLLLIITARRSRVILPLGLIIGGCIAVVGMIMEQNPAVTPLMPVLHSPWLSLHVSLVMISYAFLILCSAIAIMDLWMKVEEKNLKIILLYPGVIFLGLGIITGSVWANISWGQYWSWDPKETWALITLLIYSLPFHIKMKGRNLNIYLALSLLSIGMTYFGVNYLLGGMHSYA